MSGKEYPSLKQFCHQIEQSESALRLTQLQPCKQTLDDFLSKEGHPRIGYAEGEEVRAIAYYAYPSEYQPGQLDPVISDLLSLFSRPNGGVSDIPYKLSCSVVYRSLPIETVDLSGFCHTDTRRQWSVTIITNPYYFTGIQATIEEDDVTFNFQRHGFLEQSTQSSQRRTLLEGGLSSSDLRTQLAGRLVDAVTSAPLFNPINKMEPADNCLYGTPVTS